MFYYIYLYVEELEEEIAYINWITLDSCETRRDE